MEALLVVPWQSAKYVWMLMTLQKYDFYREVTPMTRVYTHLEMIMFSFAVTVGKTFYIHIPRSVHKHGDLLVLMWIVYTPILLTTAGCFAEMAALMPAVGAHYHYCYSTICEFVAFLVGWHLIFAYTLMTLSKCKFLSEFIDHIFLNGWISRNLKFMDRQTFWFISIPGYVDIISAMLAISMAFQAFWAVKFTKSFVNILTAIGIIIILTHIVAFMAKMDFNHISIEDTSGNEKLIDTMYVIHGALVGYESLSVLGEESKNPTTTIPLSIMSSVRFAMVLYTVYTFCISICVKKNAGVDLDEYNPLGSIVILLDMPWLYWISTLGTICSLWASAYGSMFVAVRILYAMSRDGMIFRTFSRIDRYTWKPAIPAIIFGLITVGSGAWPFLVGGLICLVNFDNERDYGILRLIKALLLKNKFSLWLQNRSKQVEGTYADAYNLIHYGFLVTFISMKTDIGFFSFITTKIMTTICLLITRYRCEKKTRSSEENEKPKEEEGKSWVLANYPEYKTSPTETTHSISMLLLYNSVISGLSAIYCLAILILSEAVDINIFKIVGFFSLVFSACFTILLRFQPTNDRTNLAFRAPSIPLFPLVAIAGDFTCFLIMSQQTWVYGFMWTGLGIAFYFIYSIRHSQEGRNLYADGSRWNPLEPTGSIDKPHPLEKRKL